MEQLRSLEDLLDLQTVDSEIDRLLHERETVPALAAYKRAHQELQQLSTERNQVADSLRQTELALDKTSGELDLAESKLAAEQNRLYAGGLSARDADYMRREVEMLDRKKREMEDEVLELMERREQLTARLAELEDSVSAADAVKVEHETVIAAAWKEIDAALGPQGRAQVRHLSAHPRRSARALRTTPGCGGRRRCGGSAGRRHVRGVPPQADARRAARGDEARPAAVYPLHSHPRAVIR